MIKFIRKFIDKVFRIYFWRIGYVNYGAKDLKNLSPIIKNNDFIYAADPFFINEKEIIFEGVKWNSLIGKIYLTNKSQIIKLKFDNRYAKYHMSFPYLFKKNGTLLILPQISNISSLISFRLDLKKNEANFENVLLKGLECRDSILFQNDNYDYIFTTVLNSKKEKFFRVYKSIKNENKFTNFPYTGIGLSSRCAGGVFNEGSKLILPIQKDKPIYGSGVNLFVLKFLENEVNFKFYKELKINSKISGINGFHTFNVHNNKFLIDYRFNKYFVFSFYYKFKLFINNYKREINYPNIIRFIILKLFFRIDNWHLNSLLVYPKYYKTVKQINKLYNFKSVNEIGCGLSEMNRLINFNNYNGFELDKSLVKLNRFLKGGKIYNINNLNKSAECTIMINFLHNLKISEINDLYRKIKNSKYILVDEIYKHAVGYKYKHKLDEIFLNHEIESKHFPLNDKRILKLFKRK